MAKRRPNNLPVLLIALGGNALIKKGQTGTVEEQFANLKVPMAQIARLSREYRIIITHGNGPQVGNLLLQQECCDTVPRLPLEILVAQTHTVPRLPLEILVAQTQGQIGYMIESTLDEALMAMGINNQPLVSLISYVVVDKNDPAFVSPSKPVGPTFSKQKAATLPFPTVKTPKGYRRVVISPNPVTIVEKREIKTLIQAGFIVICCGGGGIPVVRAGRTFDGVDAVIDKDLASARLAEEVGIDLFVIATDVQGVALDFNQPGQRYLTTLTCDEANRYIREGHFSTGAMLPKVQAAVQFVTRSGKRAVIVDTDQIGEAVAGKAGTAFV
jgi:carbamate kinase